GTHPFFFFFFAFLSHYAADAIPHWDYHLAAVDEDMSERYDHSVRRDPKLIMRDLSRIALDIAIGSSITFFVMRPELTPSGVLPFFLTVLGGILPDMLQPIFWLWKKNNPFIFLKEFHSFMHTQIRFGRDAEWSSPRSVRIGKVFQILIAGLSLFLAVLV
ncbi:MAG: hypothetical protein HYW88_00410, partial [Candidatus Sungbacteria bacterium]|nr:hypothetical protein [Candidatus Sungbacteria bacterium]